MHVNYHGSKGKRASAPMAEINIIPLVDVVLVLLIIFMATTAFVKESGLNMKLPAAKLTEITAAQENKDINIALTRNNGIYLDAKPTTAERVQAVMQARARLNPDTRVIIKADESIPYKRVVQIMDMVKLAGLPKVALGTRLPG